jgi:nucleoside phosphorylase
MLQGPVPTLVAAAYPPELDGLESIVGSERLASGQLVMRAIGIGLVEAAAGATRAIAELQAGGIDRIVFVGTAGVLPGASLSIGSIVVARKALLCARPIERLPGIMPQEVDAERRLADAVAAAVNAPQVTVACTLGITSDDVEAARLAAMGAAVEHLECFAVLAAAARAAIPATAILAIANSVGARAAEEWLAHRKDAEAAAKQALAKVLSLG